jgi:hypothetical protein
MDNLIRLNYLEDETDFLQFGLETETDFIQMVPGYTKDSGWTEYPYHYKFISIALYFSPD